jgi:DNA-binding MarR family transcriptional regulator
MKRDMEIVRKILEEVESFPYRPSKFIHPEIEGYTPEQIDYHIEILEEANLLVASRATRRIIPIRLTWDGHEFLEATRNETAWKKALDVSKQVGGVVFEVFKPLLIQYVRDQMKLQ